MPSAEQSDGQKIYYNCLILVHGPMSRVLPILDMDPAVAAAPSGAHQKPPYHVSSASGRLNLYLPEGEAHVGAPFPYCSVAEARRGKALRSPLAHVDLCRRFPGYVRARAVQTPQPGRKRGRSPTAEVPFSAWLYGARWMVNLMVYTEVPHKSFVPR